VNPETHGHLFETVQHWGDELLTAAPANVEFLIERWLSAAVNNVGV
jgi:hypothetical protein